ncbi:NTE family protein [Chishuiella changwenlii]|uniref:NTE family protein n=1 Tax=Chishuiella changwenlii TaxID=1434701 RepID=A0A1M6YSM6_9FLAO|nr:patatin-like phospholipase family protein [Chishuiella changwenlii]GGE88338.1 patatin [Chishuiella changwenlii]SHL21258.1 NTE family protein [Chishuiella changwenlii]
MRIFLIFSFFISTFSFAQESEKDTHRLKVGVVLSGGGAKGYAHVGALKKIEEAGIKIDYIGGTSMGAIIGGLYAAGYTPDQLQKIMYQLDITSLITQNKNRAEIPFFDKSYKEKYILELPFDNFKLTIPNAFSKGQGPLDLLTYLFRPVHNIDDFNQLPTPFVCIGTNIETGEEKVFRSGFLPRVVLASGAYPTMLDPVNIDGKIYVDGGVVNNFPVKEVKDMGADIIIGVELGDGLQKGDELNSAIGVLTQIMTMSIVKKTDEQKKMVDLLIKPELKNYAVTSFNEVDAIYKKGVEASDKVFDQLKEIAQKQNAQNKSRKEIKLEDYVLVKDLEVEGLKSYNENFIKGKLGIRTPELIKYDDLKTGVDKLYASGNFNNITYKISQLNENDNLLTLKVQENKNKQSVRFGLHYDDLFKTGLLLNFTSKSLIFKNSILSADVVVGDFARYNLNFFIDNGYIPSIGFNSYSYYFDKEIDLKNVSGNNSPYNKVNYNFREFTNQLYIQSTIKEKYAIGIGLEHQYTKVFTNNYIDESTNFPSLSEGYFWKAYGYIKADNRNNANFARRGFKFSGDLKYLFDSNVAGFETNYLLEGSLEANFPLNNFLSYRFTANFGTFFNENVTIPQKFYLGGYVEQKFFNYMRFYGLPFGSALGNNQLIFGSHVQAKILKNHYTSVFMNIANVTDRIEQIRLTNYKYLGYGVTYGYDSPLGPLNFMWSYSPNTKKGLFNLSLGYWF